MELPQGFRAVETVLCDRLAWAKSPLDKSVVAPAEPMTEDLPWMWELTLKRLVTQPRTSRLVPLLIFLLAGSAGSAGSGEGLPNDKGLWLHTQGCRRVPPRCSNILRLSPHGWRLPRRFLCSLSGFLVTRAGWRGCGWSLQTPFCPTLCWPPLVVRL